MDKVLEPHGLKNLKLRNRLVRSATYEGMAARDGRCTPELVNLYGRLARGGAGLIISGYAWVHPGGQCARNMLAIDRDEVIPGLKFLTEAVHEQGGAVALQMVHGGVYAVPRLTGQPVKGPSPGRFPPWMHEASEMSLKEIEEVTESFARAARRAQEAGFDAVQVHASHGYLFSQFLSPFYNCREDSYGGSIEGRARIVIETGRRIREAVGKDYPILIKMNSEDCLEGGLTVGDAERIVSLLEEAGYDAIEISGGGHASPGDLGPSRRAIRSPAREAYFLPAARRIRKATRLPLILVGGIRSLEVIQEILSQGSADFISLCRPFIREPGLPARWAPGDRAPSACTSCNRCLLGMVNHPMRCLAGDSRFRAFREGVERKARRIPGEPEANESYQRIWLEVIKEKMEE